MSIEVERGPGLGILLKKPRKRRVQVSWFRPYMERATKLYREDRMPALQVAQLLHSEGVLAKKTLKDGRLDRNVMRILMVMRDQLMINGDYSRRVTLIELMGHLREQGTTEAAHAIITIESALKELRHGK